MKNINALNLIAVLASLLPALVYFVDPLMFGGRLEEILQYLAGLLLLVMAAQLWGFEDECFEIGDTSFSTFPLICLLLFIQAIVLFVLDSKFFDTQWELLMTSLGGLIITFVLYTILGGQYRLTKKL